MSENAENAVNGMNANIYAIDVPSIMEKAGEMVADEVKFTFTTDGKNITFAASIPDCISEEMGFKIRHMGALADLLVERAYRRDDYKTDCEDDDKHAKWGVQDVR